MTSPVYPVWHGNGGALGPRRPTIEDFGGKLFPQIIECPPRDRRRAPARGYMQLAMAADRLCRMVPVLSVDFQCAASPAQGTIIHVVSVNDSLTTSNVTITGNNSRYVISHPSGLLPTSTKDPEITQASELVFSNGCFVVSRSSTTCVVYVFDSAGGQNLTTDYRFNVSFW